MWNQYGSNPHQSTVAGERLPAMFPRNSTSESAQRLADGMTDTKDLSAAEPAQNTLRDEAAIRHQLLQRPVCQLTIIGWIAPGRRHFRENRAEQHLGIAPKGKAFKQSTIGTHAHVLPVNILSDHAEECPNLSWSGR
jgi:hypothetical protein